MEGFLAWFAPIISTLIICAGQLALNAQFRHADEKREKARQEVEKSSKCAKEWQDGITARLDEQEQRINVILSAQCSQMRSDIIHKCHRYLDDLGCASTEEKQSLHAEYDDYQALCVTNGIVNHFVDTLIQRTLELPEREI